MSCIVETDLSTQVQVALASDGLSLGIEASSRLQRP